MSCTSVNTNVFTSQINQYVKEFESETGVFGSAVFRYPWLDLHYVFFPMSNVLAIGRASGLRCRQTSKKRFKYKRK